MKKSNIIFFFFLFSLLSFAQNSNTGVGTKNPVGSFHIDSKQNNNNLSMTQEEKAADDFVIKHEDGRIGIGTDSPNPSAFVELNVFNLLDGNKKGFLGPRVTLLSNTDSQTIPNPATGLQVYNTGDNSNFNFKGYVYWDGIKWLRLGGGDFTSASIASFDCTSANLYPNNYTFGVPYEGTLAITYFNGNGGFYEDLTMVSSNGLTAKLHAGKLKNGNGVLYFDVTGTPIVSSPNTTNLTLILNGVSCTVTVGQGENNLAVGQYLFYKSNEIDATIHGNGGDSGNDSHAWLNVLSGSNLLPVIDNKIRIDGYFTRDATVNEPAGLPASFAPRLVNVSPNHERIWFSAISSEDRYNGSNIYLAGSGTNVNSNEHAPNGGGWVNLDNVIYSNLGRNLTTSTPLVAVPDDIRGQRGSQEVLTLDLGIDNKWFRIYYFLLVDNKNSTDPSLAKRRLYISVQRLF